MAIAATGGLVRGTTGFGAAMVMAPPLALLIGPQAAVPITLLLETFAGAPMLPAALKLTHWPRLAPLCVAAVAAVPLGVWMLADASPTLLRRAIAGTVIVFTALMLSGWRHRGEQHRGASLGLGALSGTMLGATSIGGPPVILYLLSGPDPVAVSRAHLTIYISVISAAGLAILVWRGLLDRATATLALQMAAPFAAGVVLGGRLFARFSELRFRQITMLMMLLVSLGVLLA